MIQFGAATILLSILGGGPLAPITSIASLVIGLSLFPTIILRAYRLPPGCVFRFPPMLPATLADDMFAIVSPYVQRDPLWPAGLSTQGDWTREPTGEFMTVGDTREAVTRPMYAPRDCTAAPVGMQDGIYVLAWFAEYAYPGWRPYAPLSTMQLVFGASAVSNYSSYYYGLDVGDPMYKSCAYMMSPNVVAVVFIAIAIVAVVMMLLHVVMRLLKRLIGILALAVQL